MVLQAQPNVFARVIVWSPAPLMRPPPCLLANWSQHRQFQRHTVPAELGEVFSVLACTTVMPGSSTKQAFSDRTFSNLPIKLCPSQQCVIWYPAMVLEHMSKCLPESKPPSLAKCRIPLASRLFWYRSRGTDHSFAKPQSCCTNRYDRPSVCTTNSD